MKFLVADLEKAVVDEAEYKDQVAGRFTRDGNTITLIAIALGLHDEDSPLKPHAKAIAAAARKLAQTKDFTTTKQTAEDLKACFAATKQAVADLKAAVGGVGGDELKWGKVAPLNSLMKDEVPNINTKLKTGLRHFKTRSGKAAANAATMALIPRTPCSTLAIRRIPPQPRSGLSSPLKRGPPPSKWPPGSMPATKPARNYRRDGQIERLMYRVPQGVQSGKVVIRLFREPEEP